jgi:hypothetical protein
MALFGLTAVGLIAKEAIAGAVVIGNKNYFSKLIEAGKK